MNLTDRPSNLYSSEYYMEFENYDIRLAVLKINNFLETLSDATISIIYSNKDEHPNIQSTKLSFVRRTHTRHAVIDLLAIPPLHLYTKILNTDHTMYIVYKPNLHIWKSKRVHLFRL